ncbi:hypothetical protein [Halarchaeum sp. P4]|uniref:hypothetical protein n=1 Tax=Halarchaeum sp. P4 TaxID=3421639 RepID=UPI003EB6CE84
MSETTGPPDRHVLRLLERHLADATLVTETVFDPTTHEPRLLHAHLDADRYPEYVTAARLDVRWFTTGDFSMHYRETHATCTPWACRWDRHPNAHNTRLHFHEPPDAERTSDLTLASTHPLDVYATVLTAVEQRLDTLWNDE